MRRLFLITILSFNIVCCRRPLVDGVCDGDKNWEVTALIPVAVDWSESGITPSENGYDDDYVHRVSLRFFPQDGSKPFDKYLESNIYSGSVELPEGKYSVVVFNESIYDSYWAEVFKFKNIDSYDNFIAELVDEDEGYSTEAYKLASWSIDNFEVTPDMIASSRTAKSRATLSSYENTMLTALETIALKPLTCYVNVTANIENLVSAQNVYCEVSGFSSSVYMASGESHPDQTIHAMELKDRNYTDPENKHGSIADYRLILTKSTDDDAQFKLKFNVILSDGTIHAPDKPLEFDVENQLTRYATDDFDLSAEFSLPEVTGGIKVDGWEDEETVTIY